MLKKSIEGFSITKLLIYLMCILLISSQSIYTLSGIGQYIKVVFLGVSILLALSSLKGNESINIKKILITFLIISFYIFTLYVINKYNFGQTMKSFLVLYFSIPFMYIYFMLNVFEKNGRNYLLNCLTECITFFACVSIFMWVTISVLHLVATNQLVLLNWGEPRYIPSFFKMYFETQNVKFGSLIFMRNTWIYPEGPIYSFFLSYALVYRVFIQKKAIFSFGSIVLMITNLTTGSSTGMIILAIILVSNFVIHIYRKSKLAFFLTLVGMVILLSVIIYFVIKQKASNNAGSLAIRFEDIYIGWQGWLKHPLIGNGYGNLSVFLDRMSYTRLSVYGNGLSSGISIIAACGGMLLLLIYLIPIIRSTFVGLKTNLGVAVFAMSIFFLLITTVVQSNFVILVSLSFLLSINIKQKKKKEIY